MLVFNHVHKKGWADKGIEADWSEYPSICVFSSNGPKFVVYSNVYNFKVMSFDFHSTKNCESHYKDNLIGTVAWKEERL